MIGPSDEALDPARRAVDGGVCLFQLSSDRTSGPILDRIRADLSVRAPDGPRPKRSYVDTADRRLKAIGARLSIAKEGRAHVVRWTSADGRTRIARLDVEPAFATDLPPGPFRDALTDVIAERRLLPLAEVTDAERPIDVVDRRGKTVVRISLERWKPADDAPKSGQRPLLLRIAPVKGYDKPFERVLRLISETAPQLGEADPLALLGVDPDDGKARKVRLDPAMRADEATKAILRAQLDVIEANEAGTRQAVDPEFLHEFRVAIRRTRVALSRLKGLFPIRTVERFKREFRWLGSVTGPARDTDVYLLELPHYESCLPDGAARELQPLRSFLEQRLTGAYSDLDRALSTARYKRLLQDWRAFLDRPVPPRTRLPNAARPVGEYASECIWRTHRQVLKRGGAIDPSTPDQAVHDLRLTCKKLRYLMEYFRSLYDGDTIKDQIKALKRLQDVLGEFNDLAVQQESLMATADGMSTAGLAPLETLVALGRLVEVLAARQRDARARFQDCFVEFASTANKKRARRLFAPRAQGEPA